MHSKINPPARRSIDFNAAATMSMEQTLRYCQRLHTFDIDKRDRELAIRVECSLPTRFTTPVAKEHRDWDDGWLYGIALAARALRQHEQRTALMRVNRWT